MMATMNLKSSPSDHQIRRDRAGLTLIEFLVMTAIIAILAALLLPVVASAKFEPGFPLEGSKIPSEETRVFKSARSPRAGRRLGRPENRDLHQDKRGD